MPSSSSSNIAPASRDELDESAKIDGATDPADLLPLFLPLMMPALVAVGTYALLLAWNEYIYACVLLSSENQRTASGGARLLPQQRRGAVERDDGDRHHLLDAAADHLLLLPQPHEHRPDDRQRQGLSAGPKRGATPPQAAPLGTWNW